MNYNFLDDFNRLHDNIDKHGVKDGLENTLNRQNQTNNPQNGQNNNNDVRKLLDSEVKTGKSARKLNPFDR